MDALPGGGRGGSVAWLMVCVDVRQGRRTDLQQAGYSALVRCTETVLLWRDGAQALSFNTEKRAFFRK